MPTRIVLTYRDYEALPADGRRYELLDGALLVTAAPGLPHQRLVGELFVLLRQHVRAHGLGVVFVSPVDCILSDTTVVQPDLVFLESGRAELASPRGIEGPPTARRRDRIAFDGPNLSRRPASALRAPRNRALLDRGSGGAQHRGVRPDRRGLPDCRTPGWS